MAEDVRENEMQQVDIAALLRCLDNQGNSKVITPKKMLSGLFQERGAINNANDAISMGTYTGHEIVNSPASDYSDIIVFRYGGYIHQLFFTLNSDHIFYRRSLDGGTSWYSWKSITLT